MSLVHRVLQVCQQQPTPTAYTIALSGGVDSMLLLHLFQQLREQSELTVPINAIHVNHQLNPRADQWQVFCQQQCQRLNIHLQCISIKCDCDRNVEAQARQARYAALAEHMQVGAAVVTAHHQADQAETFLLQALRGAGVAGLAAMPVVTAFAKGYLLRPLLSVPKEQIIGDAQVRQLHWIEDDSNQNPRFDRNFIRHQVMPLLTSRWPGCAKTLARAAELSAAAMQLNQTQHQSATMAARVGSGAQLSVTQLQQLTPYTQTEVIRTWLREAGYPLPQQQQMQQILLQLLPQDYQATASVDYANVCLRRYRDQLYCLPILTGNRARPTSTLLWRGEAEISLPPPLGKLVCVPVAIGGIRHCDQYQIRFRQGGERFHPQGRQGSHPLKKCFQEWGVPPWLRPWVPLLYDNDQLVAVIGYAQSEHYSAKPGEPGYSFSHCYDRLSLLVSDHNVSDNDE